MAKAAYFPITVTRVWQFNSFFKHDHLQSPCSFLDFICFALFFKFFTANLKNMKLLNKFKFNLPWFGHLYPQLTIKFCTVKQHPPPPSDSERSLTKTLQILDPLMSGMVFRILTETTDFIITTWIIGWKLHTQDFRLMSFNLCCLIKEHQIIYPAKKKQLLQQIQLHDFQKQT